MGNCLNTAIIVSVVQSRKYVLTCVHSDVLLSVDAGTQRVISFMRQIVEHGGFYQSSNHSWIKLERVQFVGACNPPTDPGRKPMSPRSVKPMNHS